MGERDRGEQGELAGRRSNRLGATIPDSEAPAPTVSRETYHRQGQPLVGGSVLSNVEAASA